MKINKIGQMLIYFALVIYCIITLFPIYWIVITSLKEQIDVISKIPKFFNFTPTLENYAVIFGMKYTGLGETVKVNFILYLRNSLIIVPLSVLLALILGTPVAYVLARYKFLLKENLYFFYFSLYFMPAIVILVPLYYIYMKYHLYNTYIGLIIILQLINLPLVILILRSFFESLPIEIEESAKVDGCTDIGVFLKISLPLAKPGLVATCFLCIIFSWNNFLFGMILAGSSHHPVTVGILGFRSYENVLWNQMAAASVITAIIPLILAILIQKFIVTGLTLGAVKG